MRLIIDKSVTDDRKFVEQIVSFLTVYGPMSVDKLKSQAWDEYFQDLFKTKRKINTSRDIINRGFSCLGIEEYSNHFVIGVNTRDKIFYFPDKTVELACRTVNDGTLSRQQYPIFTDAFTFVLNNIDRLKSLYDQGQPLINILN